MLGCDGVLVIREIVDCGFGDVLVFMSFDEDDFVLGVIRVGVVGFLFKMVDVFMLV